MKILVIEDSERLRRSLHKGLSGVGHAVDLAGDGLEGIEYLETYEYDAIVLDLMLPGMSGLEILRQIRDGSRDVHVLILSARDRVEDRIRGLEMGADDYLVKPFDFGELCARLQALARRRFVRRNPLITIGSLSLDTVRRHVERGGQMVPLTQKELALLELLAMRPGRTFSKDQIIDCLYAGDASVTPNVVEVMVSNVRRKLKDAGEAALIRTRRGLGYVIDA